MGRRHSLLFGTDSFHDKRLTKLLAPVEDVYALREALLDGDVGGFDSAKICVNSDLESVQAAVHELFDDRDEDDLLLLYYTGHGILNQSGDLYMTLTKSRASTPSIGSLPADFIRERMVESKAKSQIVLLDCCHSGAFVNGRKKGTNQHAITKNTFDLQGSGRYVLTACSATEFSFEGGRLKEGDPDSRPKSIFTKCLVEGLMTGDAAPSEADITIDHLYHYIHRRVRDHKQPMEPHRWISEGSGDLVVAKNPNLRLPVSDELRDELLEGSRLARIEAIKRLKEILDTSKNPHQLDQVQGLLEDALKHPEWVDVERAIQVALGRPSKEVRRESGQLEQSATSSVAKNRETGTSWISKIYRKQSRSAPKVSDGNNSALVQSRPTRRSRRRVTWFAMGICIGCITTLLTYPSVQTYLFPPSNGLHFGLSIYRTLQDDVDAHREKSLRQFVELEPVKQWGQALIQIDNALLANQHKLSQALAEKKHKRSAELNALMSSTQEMRVKVEAQQRDVKQIRKELDIVRKTVALKRQKLFELDKTISVLADQLGIVSTKMRQEETIGGSGQGEKPSWVPGRGPKWKALSVEKSRINFGFNSQKVIRSRLESELAELLKAENNLLPQLITREIKISELASRVEKSERDLEIWNKSETSVYTPERDRVVDNYRRFILAPTSGKFAETVYYCRSLASIAISSQLLNTNEVPACYSNLVELELRSFEQQLDASLHFSASCREIDFFNVTSNKILELMTQCYHLAGRAGVRNSTVLDQILEFSTTIHTAPQS